MLRSAAVVRFNTAPAMSSCQRRRVVANCIGVRTAHRVYRTADPCCPPAVLKDAHAKTAAVDLAKAILYTPRLIVLHMRYRFLPAIL